MEQGEEFLLEMSLMGVWGPKDLIFKLFWFDSLEDFAMYFYW